MSRTKRISAISRLLQEDIQRLRVINGDVILLKTSIPAGQREVIAEAFYNTGRADCILITVDSFDEISVISKKDMEKAGWKWVGVEDAPQEEK